MPADKPLALKIDGLEEVIAALLTMPDKLRRRAILGSLRAGARIVQRDAKRRAPVLSRPTKYRKPGTVRDAVRVVTRKKSYSPGGLVVSVLVKPAKPGQRGARSPDDPFYWRWLETGTRKMAPRTFLQPASGALQPALREFERVLGPQIQRLNTPR